MKSSADAVNYGLEVRYTARSFTQVLSNIVSGQDISSAEFRLLRTLSEGEKFTQSELATLTAMDRPYVASLVKRMTVKGLLRTQPSKTDRRRTDLALTPKGVRLGATLFEIIDKINAKAVAGASASDLAAFLKILRLIRTNLEAVDGERIKSAPRD